MKIRDRIKELRRVRAAELRPNPRNWRLHPPAQQDALRALLAEVGYAGALLARELDDGSLELIDGHLRAETTPEETVPVLVLDVTSAEADKILATHDPLAAMAATDDVKLQDLLSDCDFQSPDVQAMFHSLDAEESSSPSESPEPEIAETYQVVVTCDDETAQRTLFERLTADGYACRLLML